MMLSKFQGPGALLIWIIVGQGPPELAVGAREGCLDSIISLFFCLSQADGLIETEILSQRPVQLVSAVFMVQNLQTANFKSSVKIYPEDFRTLIFHSPRYFSMEVCC